MDSKTKKRQRKAKKPSDFLFYILVWMLILVFVVIALFPIYFMILMSVTPDSSLLGQPALYPREITFEPFKHFFNPEYLFGRVTETGWQNGYLLNTLLVCLSNVGGVVIGSSLTAYGITKVPIRGKNIIFGIILGTVFLPGTVTSVPLYIMYSNFGWNGTLLPLIIPIWFGGGAMNIFLVRQFIRGIPNTYTEAAILDGCSTFGIYTKIILPLIKPILLYLGVSTFIGNWNDFQGPLLYLGTTRKYYTLSLALYQDFAQLGNGFLANSQMAVGIIMMIPCVILFAFFKKQLLEGVAAIGVKG